MFSESQKNAYRDIKAPDTLLAKVMCKAENKTPQRKGIIKPILALALCAVIIVGAVSVLSRPQIALSYNGSVITTDGTDVTPVPSLAKTTSMSGVALLLSADKTAEITVEGGYVNVISDHQCVDGVTTITVKNDAELYWIADGKSTLTIKTESLTESYTLADNIIKKEKK